MIQFANRTDLMLAVNMLVDMSAGAAVTTSPKLKAEVGMPIVPAKPSSKVESFSGRQKRIVSRVMTSVTIAMRGSSGGSARRASVCWM